MYILTEPKHEGRRPSYLLQIKFLQTLRLHLAALPWHEFCFPCKPWFLVSKGQKLKQLLYRYVLTNLSVVSLNHVS